MEEHANQPFLVSSLDGAADAASRAQHRILCAYLERVPRRGGKGFYYRLVQGCPIH